jgi:RNA polymerase sigma factor (sigma-70 family)
MSRPDPHIVLSQIRRLTACCGMSDLPDRELLARFHRHEDDAAFTALLQRHGPMVWNVCRRILGELHDAEDVFQAAFFVLARKADSIRHGESIGPWLHRVARQLALKSRAARERRLATKRAVRSVLNSERPAGDLDPLEDLTLREALAIVHEEIDLLPEKLRVPIILCYLQGRTNEDAAHDLGCALGTLKSRLGRGRQLLGERLTSRGVSLAAGSATLLLATAAAEATAIPHKLAHSITAAAVAFSGPSLPSSPLASFRLAQEFLRRMTVNRMKMWTLSLIAIGAVASGAVVLAQSALLRQTPSAQVGTLVDNDASENPKTSRGTDRKTSPAPASQPDDKSLAAHKYTLNHVPIIGTDPPKYVFVVQLANPKTVVELRKQLNEYDAETVIDYTNSLSVPVACTSIEELKKFVAGLTAGSELTWTHGCDLRADVPLLRSEEDRREFEEFCNKKKVKFIVHDGA